MADFALTAARIAPVNEIPPDIKTYLAAATITKGQAVYLTETAGKVNLARANATGTAQYFVGIALQDAAANRPVNVLRRGSVYGFTISQNTGTGVFLSTAVAGALADTAGSGSGNLNVPVGMVDAMVETGGSVTKVLWIDAQLAHAAFAVL